MDPHLPPSPPPPPLLVFLLFFVLPFLLLLLLLGLLLLLLGLLLGDARRCRFQQPLVICCNARVERARPEFSEWLLEIRHLRAAAATATCCFSWHEPEWLRRR